MLMINELIGFGVTKPNPVLTRTNAISTVATTSNSRSFASQGIGPAVDGRIVIVAVWIRGAVNNSTTITALTIGATSASEIATVNTNSDGNTHRVSFWAAVVPASEGTSATIAFTTSANTVRSAIVTFTLDNAANGVTPFATASSTTSANPTATTIAVPSGGAVLAIAGDGGAATRTATWANSMNEDADAGFAGVNAVTAAHLNDIPVTTAFGVSLTWSASQTVPVLLAVSFA